MAERQLWLDRCTFSEISGWIDESGPVAAIDIEVNNSWVCTLSPTAYREDLERAGLGDGRRAFAFPLAGHLRPGRNIVVIKCGTDVIYENSDLLVMSVDDPEAHVTSQVRWRGDEPAETLTWGRLMTGDSLWDIYQKAHEFRASDRILEIGPGYGRLLKTALERHIPFSSYTALELSEARVSALQSEFAKPAIEFVHGDIDTWSGDFSFDVVICSSTFEHLHPDCRAALRNIRGQLTERAHLLIDFIDSAASAAFFEENGTYLKLYSRDELVGTFTELGYMVEAVETCVLGESATGHPVKRSVVIAQAMRAAHPAISV